MSWNPLKITGWLTLPALLVAGCFPTQPGYLRDRGGDLGYYLDQATQVEYPDVVAPRLEEVSQSRPPITVVDPDFERFFDLSLEECIGIALQNNKVIRGYGTPGLQGSRVSPGIDNLTNGLAGVATNYNVAVRETEPGFLGQPGQFQNPGVINTNTGLDANQGVEAALADFDAQFTSSLFWARSDEPRNTVAPFDRTVFEQDQVTFQNEIGKRTAEGTQLFLRNSNVYTSNNIPLTTDPNAGFQILPAWWRTSLEVEVRQPLLRGRGAFINRMPIVISRIGVDQEIANLEAQLQNMVTNVEIRYWDLQLAYRNLEAAKDGRNAALETYRIIKDKFDAEADANIQQVSQAKEQYHFFDEQVIDSFNTLLTAESDLRFLMGLSHTDGQLIRPIEEPVMAPIEFDYCLALEEALEYRPELRQQRWEIKKKELSLAYAKNSLLPSLNVNGLYRFLGLGDQFTSYDENTPNFPAVGSGATNGLFEGRFQEFQLGLEYRVAVGLRRELSNVVNAQIKLARDQARLEDLELDVSRELANTLRALAANRRVMQTAFNRWTATSEELAFFKARATEGVETLDVALDAQRRLAQSEQAFYAALAEYNKTIALFHRRKGTILAYNGVSFGEGPWPGKAYQDASELARKRGASREFNYGWTRPEVISRGPGGPVPAGAAAAPSDEYYESAPAEFESGEEVFENFFPAGEVWESPATNANTPAGETIVPSPQSPGVLPQPNKTPGPQTNVMRDPQLQTVGFTATHAAQQATRNYLERVGSTPNARPLPARDSLTAPVPAAPANSGTGMVQRDVDWGKFGLTTPQTADGSVNARIKSSND